MAKYNLTDLKLSDDGDLVIADNDFIVVRNQEYVIQSIRNRLKTNDPEWFDYVVNEIGANFEDLRGLPNTPETAEKGASMIGQCLIRDGLLDLDDVYIQPAPITKDVLVFFVYINLPGLEEPFGFELNYNLHSGLMVQEAGS